MIGVAGNRAGRSPRRRARRGFSLVEIIVAITITSVLTMGLASAILIASSAAGPDTSAPAAAVDAGAAIDRMKQDLRFAQKFAKRDATTLAFAVPDRDGDGREEHVEYTWSGTPGDPLQYVYNGVKVDLLDDVQQLDLGYVYRTMTGVPLDGGGAGTPETVLLVVADAAAPTAQDFARTSLLESWGYLVTSISASDTSEDFKVAVETSNVAYVVEQQQSTALSTKLRDAPIGVVLEEAELAPFFGFSTNRDWPSPRTTVEIIDNTHEITSPFPLGFLTLFTADAEVVTLSEQLAPDGRRLATQEWSGPQAALMAVESGGAVHPLWGGSLAENRRVMLPWGRTGFDINLLNTDGLTVLQRSIEWAAAGVPVGTGPTEGRFGHEAAGPTPVSGVRHTQIATRATLAEAGTVESITVYAGGANNRGVRLAIYSDSAGEPDTLLVESDSVNTGSSAAWITATVTPTALAAGDYWLALAFERDSQDYYQDSGGETRYHAHDAQTNGFLASWGVSDDSFAIKVSIYATYVSD